tara:strand:- start:37842 stop:38015 length:174 start_codon:yes stop_codon:yes gene_type:complete
MMPTRKTTKNEKRSVTEGRAREIAEDMVREAVQQQARDLEAHLNSIHERLVQLETKR